MGQVTVHNVPPGNEQVFNFSNADVSGCEDVVAAVAGSTHYIKKILVTASSAITVTIGSGETTGAVTTALLGPIPFSASGFCHEVDLGRRGIKCTPGEAVTVDASGAGVVSVVAVVTTVQDSPNR